ncbi:MAG: hypothetical protein ACOCQR_02900 [bacterium]
MCYGSQCHFEDSYGECTKPNDIDCPLSNFSVDEYVARVMKLFKKDLYDVLFNLVTEIYQDKHFLTEKDTAQLISETLNDPQLLNLLKNKVENKKKIKRDNIDDEKYDCPF